MKLIYCPNCHDLITIRKEKARECHCGKSWGIYLDDEKANLGGDAIGVGINNNSFFQCLHAGLWTFEGIFYAPYGWCESPNILRNGIKQYEEDSINIRYVTKYSDIPHMTDLDLKTMAQAVNDELEKRGQHG